MLWRRKNSGPPAPSLAEGTLVRAKSADEVGALIAQGAVVEVDPAIAEDCGAFRDDFLDAEEALEEIVRPVESEADSDG